MQIRVVQEKNSLLSRLLEEGKLQTMLDEVESIPVLHKVTGAGHSCKGGGAGGVDIGGGGP